MVYSHLRGTSEPCAWGEFYKILVFHHRYPVHHDFHVHFNVNMIWGYFSAFLIHLVLHSVLHFVLHFIGKFSAFFLYFFCIFYAFFLTVILHFFCSFTKHAHDKLFICFWVDLNDEINLHIHYQDVSALTHIYNFAYIMNDSKNWAYWYRLVRLDNKQFIKYSSSMIKRTSHFNSFSISKYKVYICRVTWRSL